ncbi:hypothetical protein RI129_006514 [Pyrocoelia pectoralis]|uniref:RING finger protein nhl-1 n=1 Tax=Pyrocoelia pectoralis TaxID=417401 RepID=A0AAN7VK75_9COLE
MEQFEQLLTCAICLDRYRNPKLLPCQHSFCMEPCLEGLVDYVRRQVKCPECRAEHRIPYQGVQGFPTNVTLQRFLELHIEITGELPDPTSGQIMERCNICSEKAYCSFCFHCDKKVCPDCKGAHMDILRREICRINNQIRRSIHRLQDSLSLVERNTQNIQSNCSSVSEEVEEIYRRLSKALKDRTDYLRGEVDRYLCTELRTLTGLKENLEQEISNILSNCDLADKHINENVDWDDCELMDAKEIFLKTVEFIRNFEYENSDYGRKVRLILAHDPNQLVLHVAGFGDLNIAHQQFGGSGGLLQPPGGGPGLMRSKSDHRLATQFRQQEERGYDKGYGENAQDDLPLSGRKFGDRTTRSTTSNTDRYDRYGRGGGADYGDEYEDTNRPARSRYRSRFNRHAPADNDSDTEPTTRGVRFSEQHKERERTLDTEEVTRGPLSGIQRLADSPRVMKKLQENETNKKKEKENPPAQPPPQPKVTQPTIKKPPVTTRQVSEDDEISKIKKQNKGATTSTAPPEPTPTVTVTKRADDVEDRHANTRRTPAPEAASSGEDSDASESSVQQIQRKTVKTPIVNRRTSGPESTPTHKKASRSTSSDSTTSTESSASSAIRSSTVPHTPEETKPKYTPRITESTPERTRTTSTGTSKGSSNQKTFQSRFLPNRTPTVVPTPPSPKEPETSSEEETESEEESEDETPKPVTNTDMSKTDIGALLARSAHARDTSDTSSKKEEPPYSKSRYDDTPTTYTARTRNTPKDEEPTGYTSRFINKNRTSTDDTKASDDSDRYSSPKSRYSALKDRRQRLARSKSSHAFGDDDETDEAISPTTANPTAYMQSRGYGSTTSGNDLARSRSSHALKSRENSPDRTPTNEKDGAALSSWARYLKNKYGNRSSGKDKDTGTGTVSSSGSSSSAARRLSLGLPLRSSDVGSSDDDQKNMSGSPTTPTAVTVAAAGIAAAAAGTSPKEQYLQKCNLLFKIGGRGSEPGLFTWPRGVAVGPDNSIVVADSSNHRVQVFDANGNFLKEFGQYGNGEGEFDCLAGVAINRIGQFIIADRYNHRIQVFDPAGRFLRAFGSQGAADGRFNYPWGITTDSLGFIYVCDKENHRVQVFQSDGTFVGKFGSMGNKPGQLEHPHYIAVSNTNRVIVSDSNNHRIQIFDVNGKVLSTFGSEGSNEGQFKFPRGVAVDDQGFICVADSGNNRIQIFHPDGTFLKAFGSWGSGDGEFKGLEGIAVTPSGNILLCDRENHRIQVF